MKHQLCIALTILFVVLMTAGLLQAEEMRLSADSFVLSNGTWIKVADLKAGDIVQTLDGHTIRITEVEDVEAEEPISCYAPVLNDTKLAPVVGPGLIVSTHVVDRRCSWI